MNFNDNHLQAFSWINLHVSLISVPWYENITTSQPLVYHYRNCLWNHNHNSCIFLLIHAHTHPTVPPPPPTNIRLMVVSDNSIFVTWDPPAENPSNRPLTYSVYTSLDGRERFFVMGGINATNYTIMSKRLHDHCMCTRTCKTTESIHKNLLLCVCPLLSKIWNEPECPLICLHVIVQ